MCVLLNSMKINCSNESFLCIFHLFFQTFVFVLRPATIERIHHFDSLHCLNNGIAFGIAAKCRQACHVYAKMIDISKEFSAEKFEDILVKFCDELKNRRKLKKHVSILRMNRKISRYEKCRGYGVMVFLNLCVESIESTERMACPLCIFCCVCITLCCWWN